MTSMRKITRHQLLRIGIIALQWFLLTVALGAVVVYSSDALEGYITPNLESGFMFFGAFVFAFLLGISIESFKLLMPLVVLMCVGASIVFMMVVFSPTYAEVTIRTIQLENYATTRAFLFTVLMFLPAVVGAGFGNLAGGYFRDDILTGDQEAANRASAQSWYERRSQTSSPADADSKS